MTYLMKISPKHDFFSSLWTWNIVAFVKFVISSWYDLNTNMPQIICSN